MNVPESLFGDMTVEEFLRDYWQKKPLLVRDAWPGFRSPVEPAEFLSMTMRDDVLSRLIVERTATGTFELSGGPFEQEEIDDLPDTHWTVLIQEMDQVDARVRRMLRAVDFLPNWRLDDIMVSLAAEKGGVGAHIDNYDVFLLQGWGRRRWQIGAVPVEEEILVEGIDVSILADFEPAEEWILEPGDMLYLPPRFAHFGVAVDTCMTYSIGCRAPATSEVLPALLEQAIETTDPDDRFSDPDLRRAQQPGRLGRSVLGWARQTVMDLLEDEEALLTTLGSVLSEPRRYREIDLSEEVSAQELRSAVRDGAVIRPRSPSQGLYEVVDDGSILLFVSGEVFKLDGAMLPCMQALTGPAGVTAEALERGDVPDEAWPFLAQLVSEGLLVTA